MFYFKNKIKKRDKLRLIVLVISLLLLALIALLFKPILFKNWLSYPDELRAKIALSKWQASFQINCYGQCLRDRQVLKEIALKYYLHHDSDKLIDILKNDFLNSTNDDYSLAIISFLTDINFVLCDDFLNLINQNISIKAKQYLVTYFPDDFKDNLSLRTILMENIESNLTRLDEKIASLSMLSIYQDEETSSYLLSLIIGDYPLVLKQEALLNIGDLKQETLILLADALVGNSFPLALNSRLVWLISDYYQDYPEISAKYLSLVYQNESLDVFSRGFAALALNELLEAQLRLPVPSQSQWQEYYRYY